MDKKRIHHQINLSDQTSKNENITDIFHWLLEESDLFSTTDLLNDFFIILEKMIGITVVGGQYFLVKKEEFKRNRVLFYHSKNYCQQLST